MKRFRRFWTEKLILLAADLREGGLDFRKRIRLKEVNDRDDHALLIALPHGFNKETRQSVLSIPEICEIDEYIINL
ncbi:hypothetical protein DCMF_09645 [Candidatus Formimonas warabiya]|uniref:Uncharacterized protein n=1 Tax=Formimonas warabiya TaxID=1761012 RepID=A0A3G1KRB3_FORW1|nr:hypothetical protein DCMF_09645 [Candidatus Formimonas warabiya]